MKFKIGISGDLINSNGLPCFGEESLQQVYDRDDVEVEWMDPDIKQLSKEMTSRYDAILLNLPKANKDCVEGKDWFVQSIWTIEPKWITKLMICLIKYILMV